MLNTIIGLLLLITFFVFIYYILKGGNLMVGFFVMAILWSVIGMVPFKEAIADVFAKPALNYGATIIYIAFGSWFGRVLVDSGIAGSISSQTQKVGRRSPVFAAILVCLVTSLIFISAYGVGSVIAIGVILLPILFSLGVPKAVAVSAFTLSIGAPMYVNVVLFNQIKVFFPAVDYNFRYLQFGWIATMVQMLAVICLILLCSAKIHANIKSGAHDQFAGTQITGIRKVSYWTYVIPLVPVFLNMFFHWDAVPALIFSTLLAMLMTGEFKSYTHAIEFMNKTISQSIGDISGLIMFLMALVMFSAAASKNTSRFGSLFAAIIPHSTLILALVIGILAPLALFRGPLHVWGAGAATAAVLAGTHLFSPWFLLPVMYIPSILAVSADVTQSWNIWALNYTKLDSKPFLKVGVPVIWICSIINEFIAYLFFG
ncbi:MAG: gluconate:proton symporter [Sporolactobacillus sp.]|jgi:H+/gluconate symporter-like permease|nr:gluconate:proton symporter [Sporolactobacillus sp.]